MAENKSKWFCVGRSGDTVDGRYIRAEWLTECAETYSPAKYGARVNIEHFKSFGIDWEFQCVGDVLELRIETAEDGETELWALLDPKPELLHLSDTRQKVYFSMELFENFAKTGKFYLSGVAVTDDPASLGTSYLKFSAKNQTNTFTLGKIQMQTKPTDEPQLPTDNHNHGNVTQTFSQQAQPTEKEKGFFEKLFSSKFGANEDLKAQLAEKDKIIADHQTELEFAGKVVAGLESQITELSKKQETQSTELSELTQTVTTLAAQPTTPEREPHAGAQVDEFGYEEALY